MINFMVKRILTLFPTLLLSVLLLEACMGTAIADTEATVTETVASVSAPVDTAAENSDAVIKDGKYIVSFDSDGSMFHVNETCNGTAVLSVENGKMSVHIIMPSKNILNLFCGMAEEAAQPDAELIQPAVVEVTYPDGFIDKVHAFDIPVPVLDEEFNVAIIGKKGKWYDHKVVVSVISEYSVPIDIADGKYSCEVSLEGGSGRAGIESPAAVTAENGYFSAEIIWSSPFYDYMIVNEEKYYPVNSEGNSVFVIPVYVFDKPISVIADTTAMSTPHEVEYTLTFNSGTLK